MNKRPRLNLSPENTTLEPAREGGVRQALLCAALVTACLLPFVNKAFHIDDPMYLWAARHIQEHPIDFYGFDVNWIGAPRAMWEVNYNPPLVSYFLALGASIVGWGEVGLHLFMLLPTVALTLGAFCLARRWSPYPVVGVLAGVFTPAFLLSSSNLMSDVLMLAFYVWAIELWARGLEQKRIVWLILAGVAAGLAFLTKYFGITLVPLLAAYGFAERRKPGAWLLPLLIPIAFVVAYEVFTQRMYGVGLFQQATAFPGHKQASDTRDWFHSLLIGLCFAGGCNASLLFFAPYLWSRRIWIGFAASAAVLAVTFLSLGKLGSFVLRGEEGSPWIFMAQALIFSLVGIQILFLAVADPWRNRDAPSLLLGLWVLGTFAWAAVLNWSVTGRTILPMAVAVGILVARRLAQGHWAEKKTIPRLAPLAAAACLALIVVHADYVWANSVRSAAIQLSESAKAYPGKIYSMGYWGFQWYMEENGHTALDLEGMKVQQRFSVLEARNNSAFRPIPGNFVEKVYADEMPTHPWIATMESSVGAGFYSSVWGPLPYVFGNIPPDTYYIIVMDMLTKTPSDGTVEASNFFHLE